MRRWLARKIHPPMCLASRGVAMSYKAPDTITGETIQAGVKIETHRSCGKRRGHRGEHGPWGRWFMWRTRIANRLDP